ncbi:MAG: right-handed parallel beta-helix repeat-containing protein [Phycisphaerales bacterium]
MLLRTLALAVAAALGPAAGADDLPVVRVEHDDVTITASCRLLFPATPVPDMNGDGVVHVRGDGLVLDMGGTALMGSAAAAPPWNRAGTGIVLQGRGITLRNGRVSGFKTGVLAQGCDGLVVQDLDLSDNWAERLRSTGSREDGADWLWPHRNDGQEWRTRWGAGICVERSRGCTLSRIKARRGQNGIILDRVEESRVHDCDCSFLSGWGLAMWRSSANVIARNAFDFCVRGYSHGVYNRGQDSAGILLFEQCCRNVIALNSVTHGGDGLFAFAGREALGEDVKDPAPEQVEAARRRGCNGNVIVGNDFSWAVAHGLELTFSFDNVVARNRFRECAICGIWAGYSQSMRITDNEFTGNGGFAAAGERGGINAEHARGIVVDANRFHGNAVGVRLWWDQDDALAATPWARANGVECRDNVIVGNRFKEDLVAVELERCGPTVVADNAMDDVREPLRADDASRAAVASAAPSALPALADLDALLAGLPGSSTPVGARAGLDGRQHIVITERGPHDGTTNALVFLRSEGGEQWWRVLGPGTFKGASVVNAGGATLSRDPKDNTIRVYGREPRLDPYELVVTMSRPGDPPRAKGERLTGRGVLFNGNWNVRFFPWSRDPREDPEGWRAEAGNGVELHAVRSLHFPFGMEGPSQMSLSVDHPEKDLLRNAGLPKDRFGTIATTTITIPRGRWKLTVTSDDGVRVLADGKTVIERWDWHAPREDSAILDLAEEREVSLVVEHFELDGYAMLLLDVSPAEGP